MKKRNIAIIAILAFTSITVNAKIWLGGEMTLNTHSTSRAGYLLNSGTQFEISPEVGYYVSDKLSIGLSISLAHIDNAEVHVIDQKAYGTYNEWSVIPFLRYTYYRIGNFSFYADGGAYYNALVKSGEDETLHGVGLGIRPGLAYAISDKVGLTGHLGSVGYDYQWMKENGQTLTNNAFCFNIFGSISFGAYINF